MVVVALDHDARQPQHSVEMGLRILRLMTADLDSVRADLAQFRAHVHRMKAELGCLQAAVRQLTDTHRDLVDAIRLEFDDLHPVARSISADELIERCTRSHRALAVNIELRGARSPLVFVSDERWVERILNNLIANAIAHSGANKILVSARQRGDDIAFEVRDNGRGMTQETVTGAFEPIEGASLLPLGESPLSSGLGLYNVWLFAERLGGLSECISAPDRGTLFRVRLPGPVGRVPLKRQPFQAISTEFARSKLVAVLDNDPSVLKAMKRMFEGSDVEVFCDSDPLRWLNVVTNLKRMPDLFLLGFELNGHDILLQLDIVRRKWGDRAPDIIVLTRDKGHGRLRVLSKTTTVMQKPLTDADCDLVIASLFKRKHSGAGKSHE